MSPDDGLELLPVDYTPEFPEQNSGNFPNFPEAGEPPSGELTPPLSQQPPAAPAEPAQADSPVPRPLATRASPHDAYIDHYAAQHGVDANLMRRIMQIESGGDATNTTGSYKGLFQLSNDEFRRYGGTGSIYDPEQNTNAAARKFAAESDAFRSRYGREPTATDIYMLHQQGEGGYGRHMNAPDRPAWENMYSTFEGRKKGKLWSQKAIWQNVPDDLKRQFGNVNNVTSQDFVDLWHNKVEDGVGDTSAFAAAAARVRRRYPTREPDAASLAASQGRVGWGDMTRSQGQGLADLAMTPGGAYKHGLTPEQEVAWGTGMGMNLMGAGTPFAMRGAAGVAGGKLPIPEMPQPVPPFHSAVANVIAEAKQPSAPAAQWQGMVKNAPGVKPEEMQWLGVDDWLKEQKGPVTKQALQDYVAANQIELKEVTKGEPPSVPNITNDENGFLAYARRQRERDRELTPEENARENEILERSHAYHLALDESENTKFASYQLPGGENYREMLLTLPDRVEQAKQAMRDEATQRGYGDRISEWPDQDFANRYRQAVTNAPTDTSAFRGSHWDEPNVLAHVRFNDRTIDGKKALLLEEIQSDWHQAGRKKGYKTGDPQFDEEFRGQGVPDAPFKTTWPELALKRMIRYAAENGYEKIAWTPGDVQAARYDLSKHVDYINVKPKEDNRHVAIYGKSGVIASGLVDKQGKVIQGHDTMRDAVGKDLSDVVGKDVADKIMASNRENKLSGLDLKVGGEGMKAFYDKMLPAAANKIGKKYGAKVGRGDITKNYRIMRAGPQDWRIVGEDNQGMRNPGGSPLSFGSEAGAKQAASELGQPVHTLDITPELRKTAITKGFPLFQGSVPLGLPQPDNSQRAAGGLVVSPVDHDPFAKPRALGGRVNARNIDASPTEAQKEAGNYAKDHVSIHGLDLTIENAKGASRSGVGKGGKRWSVVMPAHYGYIKGTVGKDKDHVDCYLGPHIKSPTVYVVHQLNAETGKFDEHKCLLGFASKASAIQVYLKAFSDGRGRERCGNVVAMSVDAFKDWLDSGKTDQEIIAPAS